MGLPPRSKTSSLSALQNSIRNNVFKAVGADTVDLEHQDNLGRNFLHSLVSYKKRTHLMKTVDISALPSNLFNQKDQQGLTPAMLAVAFKQFDALRYFLLTPSIRQKVDWKMTNFSGETVLDMATAGQAEPSLLSLLQNLEEERTGPDGSQRQHSENKREQAGTDFYSQLATIADRLSQSKTLLQILEEDRRELLERQRQEEDNLKATQSVLEESLRESQRVELDLRPNSPDVHNYLRALAAEQERERFYRDCEADRQRLAEKYSGLVREIDQQISEQRTTFLQLESSLETHYGRPRKTAEVPECPICLESLVAPRMIYQCQEGHLVCGDCRRKVKVCSECRHQAGYQSRNRFLEQTIARNINTTSLAAF